MSPKKTICLWYESGALDAAHFDARTFPHISVGKIEAARRG